MIYDLKAEGRDRIPAFHHSAVPIRCRLCKTNPIWRRQRGAGRLPCETKPICPRATRGASTLREKSYDKLDTDTASEKRSQFAHGRQWATAGNAASATGAAAVRNEANSHHPGGRDTPPFRYSIIPPSRSDTDCAKRTQFGDVKCAKRTQFPARRAAGPADCAKQSQLARANRAKRSQFAGDGSAMDAGRQGCPAGAAEPKRAKRTQFGGVKCAKRTQFSPSRRSGQPIIPLFHRSGVPIPRPQGRGASVRNEPNYAVRWGSWGES